MRGIRRLVALPVAVLGVAVVAMSAAGPTLADPPLGTTPRVTDVVGTGSGTAQYLFDQFSHDYNNEHKSATTKLYSWDAVNPDTLQIGDPVTTKVNCAQIARPDGSSAGISSLDGNSRPAGNTTNYCIDFARSSRGPGASDPPYAPGGVAFVPLAGDAVTYATRSASAGGTNAPSSLTTGQLAAIYTCVDTNWDQVGGPNAPIDAFLPQAGSQTLAAWLTALGGGDTSLTPGSCVSTGSNSLPENEGLSPLLNDPDAIFIYSVAAYLAQFYRSPACTNPDCSPVSDGSPCTPSAGENLFGCDETGVLTLNEINGTAPATPWPLPPASSAIPQASSQFDLAYQYTDYAVVRYDPSTADHIPGPEPGAPGGLNLEQFFGAAGQGATSADVGGWVCSSGDARAGTKHYGLRSIGAACGLTSALPPIHILFLPVKEGSKDKPTQAIDIGAPAFTWTKFAWGTTPKEPAGADAKATGAMKNVVEITPPPGGWPPGSAGIYTITAAYTDANDVTRRVELVMTILPGKKQ